MRATYGIDVHNRSTQRVSEEERKAIPVYDDYYEIPLRSLISAIRQSRNLGRFSSDFLVAKSCRPLRRGPGDRPGVVSGDLVERTL